MNAGKIRQVFELLAKKILDVQGAPIPVEGELEQTSPSFPTIRWGQVQHSVVVEACLQAVDELTVILEASGYMEQFFARRRRVGLHRAN
jgi:hypothetical protein